MSSIAIQPLTFERRTVRGAADGSTLRPVRLTRRGRIVVFAAALLLALAALMALTAVSNASQDQVPSRTSQIVTVHSGDTLWGYASGLVEPGGDVRTMVDHLKEMNQLESSVLRPGQKLRLPSF